MACSIDEIGQGVDSILSQHWEVHYGNNALQMGIVPIAEILPRDILNTGSFPYSISSIVAKIGECPRVPRFFESGSIDAIVEHVTFSIAQALGRYTDRGAFELPNSPDQRVVSVDDNQVMCGMVAKDHKLPFYAMGEQGIIMVDRLVREKQIVGNLLFMCVI